MALSVMSSCTTTSVASLATVPAGGSGNLKQAPTTVRFGNDLGAAAFKRASLMVVRAEGKTEPGRGGRGNAPTTPTSPPGLSGTEIPLAVIRIQQLRSSGAGHGQGRGERIAYVRQDCGYVYDQETPFEDVPDDYKY